MSYLDNSNNLHCLFYTSSLNISTGLAVIAESGIAASRPMGTAVATSGVAIARPIGTAIAGIDPSLLGIDFNAHNGRKLRIKGRTY